MSTSPPATTDSAIQAVLDNSRSADTIVLVNRRKKATTRAELERLPHDELVVRVLALQAHNTQLVNLLKKEQAATQALADEKRSASDAAATDYTYDTGVPATQRPFAHRDRHRRHILLRFYYQGWDYQGFTTQDHTTATIEHHLFCALLKTCLIESRESSNYHRCGRTDKGVSAFSQVISIDVRSRFAPAEQLTAAALDGELNYCETLNRVLPANIKCVAWAPCADAAFSARFDCRRRSYRYFFPRGAMNVEAMQQACQYLVGVNDFRNLCKMDVQNGVVEFVRQIRSADIRLASRCVMEGEAKGDEEDAKTSPYDMFYMELVGKAYLWHQVRCIMAILLLVGQELERPEVMRELLDVEANPCTPQYSLASDVALNLWDVRYTGDDDADAAESTVRWRYDELNLQRLLVVLQSQWTVASVQTTMMRQMLAEIERVYAEELPDARPVVSQQGVLQEGSKSKVYQPLMERVRCSSLENRIAHYAKKRRIELQCVKEDAVDVAKTNAKDVDDDKVATA